MFSEIDAVGHITAVQCAEKGLRQACYGVEVAVEATSETLNGGVRAGIGNVGHQLVLPIHVGDLGKRRDFHHIAEIDNQRCRFRRRVVAIGDGLDRHKLVGEVDGTRVKRAIGRGHRAVGGVIERHALVLAAEGHRLVGVVGHDLRRDEPIEDTPPRSIVVHNPKANQATVIVVLVAAMGGQVQP